MPTDKETNELEEDIWAVITVNNVLTRDINYDRASSIVKLFIGDFQYQLCIVTSDVADRMYSKKFTI